MSDEGQISVFLCDDSSSLRRLIRLQLEDDPRLSVVGEASEPVGCTDGVTDVAPDVVLIDHGVIAGRDPHGFLAGLRAVAPGAQLVLFSGLPRDLLEHDAEAWGADSFIHKDTSGAELARALKQLAGA